MESSESSGVVKISKPYNIPPADKAEMARLYKSGLSVRAVAARLDRSYGGVYRCLHEAGVELRVRGLLSPENERIRNLASK